jgi:NAD dependent epimerase/dehydratase family enzyme
VPRFGPRLLLGSELADSLLFTSARVQPAVLESSGFAFSDPDLEIGLKDILRPSS